MAAHVTHSRKGLRRLERATGERLVWATDNWVTTVDHRHLFQGTGGQWYPIEDQEAAATVPGYSKCGLPTALSSCEWLFGEFEFGFGRGLMRGPCHKCGVGCGELHRWDCEKLSSLMDYVNPDYWPRPVHRPMWMDDPRCPSSRTTLTLRLAITMDVPYELLLTGADTNHWSYRERQWGNTRAQLNAVLAEVAPKILHDAGLDPARYRIELEEP